MGKLITSGLIMQPLLSRHKYTWFTVGKADLQTVVRGISEKLKDVKNKWENSSWGRKLIVQKKRASLNDFDRFKIMLAKIKKAGVVRQELAKLKKETTA
ncbi:60S ribosomal protein L14-2 [Tanacetum coccineum]